MTYDIVYRPDGLLVLHHLGDEAGNIYCGQPRSPFSEVTADNPPACVDCMLKLKEQALAYYEELTKEPHA